MIKLKWISREHREAEMMYVWIRMCVGHKCAFFLDLMWPRDQFKVLNPTELQIFPKSKKVNQEPQEPKLKTHTGGK